MDNNDSVLNSLLKRLSTIYGVFTLLFTLGFGVYVVYRIFCNLALRRRATTELEYNYFSARMMACIMFSYGFVGIIMGAATFWYQDYWPAISALWVDHGGTGQAGHSNAVAVDILLSMSASWLFYWLSTSMGRTVEDYEGTESFRMSDSEELKVQVPPIMAELARLRAIRPPDLAKIADLEETLDIVHSLWGPQ